MKRIDVSLGNKRLMYTKKGSFYSSITFSILFVIAVAATIVLPVSAHTFSQNENALFLTRVNQIHSQLQLSELSFKQIYF